VLVKAEKIDKETNSGQKDVCTARKGEVEIILDLRGN
jgi:hypothetical protein